MKTNWPILAAIVLAVLIGWLDMTLAGHIYPGALLLAGSFTLSYAMPQKFGLIALILGGSIPLAHAVAASFNIQPPDPFSWLGGVLWPLGLAFLAAFSGGAFGWFHSIVKDDF